MAKERASKSRSVELACHAELRDLLRNLDFPDRVSRGRLLGKRSTVNPRALVEAALVRLPQRYRAIITRCDLAGQLNTVVAQQLGLSERYFYRERRKAIEALGTVLGSMSDTEFQPATGVADPNETFLACAAALQNAGQIDAAIALLDRALSQVADDDTRGRIAIRLADLCGIAGDLDRAAACLTVAQRIAAACVSSEETTNLLKLEAEAAYAAIVLRRGAADRARRLLESTLAEAKAYPAGVDAKRKACVIINAQSQLSLILEGAGKFGSALEAIIEANETARRHDVGRRMQVQTLLSLLGMKLIAATPASEVMNDLHFAYRAAQENGLVRECMTAGAYICGIHAMGGQPQRALDFGAATLESGPFFAADHHQDVAMVHFFSALAYLQLRNAIGARRMLDNVRKGVDGRSVHAVVPNLIESEILFVERRYETAHAVAQSAVKTAVESGSGRLLGTAFRILAEIEHALGYKRKALVSIDRALDLLKGAAPPFALAQAYRCSARLSGNAAHRRTARDLGRVLGVNVG